MHHWILTTAAVLTILFTDGLHAFDFAMSTYDMEGIEMRYYVASDGTNTIAMQPPIGWALSVQEGRVRLSPANLDLGEIEIRILPGTLTAKFDEPGMLEWTEFAKKLLPPAAERVEVVEQNNDYLQIERLPSAEFQFTYGFPGEDYRRSIVLWRRSQDLVAFIYTNTAKNFEQGQRDFQSTIFSVHWE